MGNSYSLSKDVSSRKEAVIETSAPTPLPRRPKKRVPFPTERARGFYAVSKGQPSKGPVCRRQMDIRARAKTYHDRIRLPHSLEEETEVYWVEERAPPAPIPPWRGKSRGHLIPRVKLRTPLPNYQSTLEANRKSYYERIHSGSSSSDTFSEDKSQMPAQIIQHSGHIPTSFHQSEKIKILQNSSSLEIQRETVSEGGRRASRYSSRYEIYNSAGGGTRPFGKGYRDHAMTSSSDYMAESASASSTCSETTYLTCNSAESDVPRMTAFQMNDQTEVASGYQKKAFQPLTGRAKNPQLDSINWIGNDVLKSPKLVKQYSGTIAYSSENLEKPRSEENNFQRCRSLFDLLDETKPATENFTNVPASRTTSEICLNEIPRKKFVDITESYASSKKEEIKKTLNDFFTLRRNHASAGNRDNNSSPAIVNISAEKSKNVPTVATCRVTAEIKKSEISKINVNNVVTPQRDRMTESFALPPDRQTECYTLPRAVKCHKPQLQKHFYYHMGSGRSTSKLNDDELPDPEKVRNVRKLFETVLKSRIEANKNNTKTFSEIKNSDSNLKAADICKQPIRKCLSVDTYYRGVSKWNDYETPSESSGVGSDISGEMSPRINDIRSNSTDSGTREVDNILESETSESEEQEFENSAQPISEEILEKIREFGTSVTYYGGKIISRSNDSPYANTLKREMSVEKTNTLKKEFTEKLNKMSDCSLQKNRGYKSRQMLPQDENDNLLIEEKNIQNEDRFLEDEFKINQRIPTRDIAKSYEQLAHIDHCSEPSEWKYKNYTLSNNGSWWKTQKKFVPDIEFEEFQVRE